MSYTFAIVHFTHGKSESLLSSSMVVGFAATCAISAYQHYSCELESRSWRSVLDTTLSDKVLH